MNLNTYKYFNEVVASGSIRRAADRLHVAPSAISRQIALLEHSLGVMLLERTNTGIRLTPAGMMLERFTRKMVRDLDRIHESIKNLKGLREGEVKIWVIEAVVQAILPRIVTEFNENYPAIQFSIYSESSDRTIEAIMRDEIDIGIVFNMGERPGIEVIKRCAAPIQCLVSPKHPLADHDSLTLEDICAWPIALPVSSFGLRQTFDKNIRNLHLNPQSIVNTNNLELTKAMAMAGRTLTIGPEQIATKEIQQNLLRAIPIENEAMQSATIEICVHRDRSLSFAAHQFLKHICKEIG
ncbi:LysR family transcriptional regulator [Erwinia billingiae]|jgi:DNA-binding transcriptional LysR family regulator|uniref:Transcriptional regulator, LysR family n=1 Tax=Erwinia billingiae (strain Eb661) TaxID=634500 RepID=D8MPD6_ERWBE|nr:LysR family transcriptional regulator [Erwinia billingiae]PRB61248.1 LysR family transcriptional regulator [Erwinia billingiae]CAX58693.1 Transcriptional regulator, LysR family [Erwinia billingiae Eb661]